LRCIPSSLQYLPTYLPPYHLPINLSTCRREGRVWTISNRIESNSGLGGFGYWAGEEGAVSIARCTCQSLPTYQRREIYRDIYQVPNSASLFLDHQPGLSTCIKTLLSLLFLSTCLTTISCLSTPPSSSTSPLSLSINPSLIHRSSILAILQQHYCSLYSVIIRIHSIPSHFYCILPSNHIHLHPPNTNPS
jgi:hypothetical protein